MRRPPRITLRELLLIVVLAALTFAAMRAWIYQRRDALTTPVRPSPVKIDGVEIPQYHQIPLPRLPRSPQRPPPSWISQRRDERTTPVGPSPVKTNGVEIPQPPP